MCRRETFFACVVAAIIAAAFTALTSGASIHTERAPFVTASHPPASLHDIDRNQKGDRLKVRARTARDNEPGAQLPSLRPQPAVPVRPDMLVGCDPAFSPLSKSSRSNFPSRCLS